ncbi:hypothetical protein Scep_013750 [Stephania cephalantha]|uniref:Uncharacterized protein n=1 Tax=Stephania cephalantha TaxID=152367 RepID=A0AAP0J027_9MAGN
MPLQPPFMLIPTLLIFSVSGLSRTLLMHCFLVVPRRLLVLIGTGMLSKPMSLATTLGLHQITLSPATVGGIQRFRSKSTMSSKPFPIESLPLSPVPQQTDFLPPS